MEINQSKILSEEEKKQLRLQRFGNNQTSIDSTEDNIVKLLNNSD